MEGDMFSAPRIVLKFTSNWSLLIFTDYFALDLKKVPKNNLGTIFRVELKYQPNQFLHPKFDNFNSNVYCLEYFFLRIILPLSFFAKNSSFLSYFSTKKKFILQYRIFFCCFALQINNKSI